MINFVFVLLTFNEPFEVTLGSRLSPSRLPSQIAAVVLSPSFFITRVSCGIWWWLTVPSRLCNHNSIYLLRHQYYKSSKRISHVSSFTFNNQYKWLGIRHNWFITLAFSGKLRGQWTYQVCSFAV